MKKLGAALAADEESRRTQVVPWIRSIGDCYGYKLLCMLFASQFVLKSFANSYTGSASVFIFRSFAVTGPQLQVYGALASLPWALKPLLGMLSDGCPILGYKKRYYMLLVSIAGVVGFCVVGLAPGLTLHAVIVAQTLISMQIAGCDLLVEARYASQMREKPEKGPDLMAFLHGGMTVSKLVASCSIGFVIDHMGPRAAYAICIPLAAFIVIPTIANFLEEKPETRQTDMRVPATKSAVSLAGELYVISGFMVICCAALAYAGMSLDPLSKFQLSMTITFVLAGLLLLMLRPEIGPVMTYFFVRSALQPSISGASFYFFTDTSSEYGGGPHFSAFFYTTTMGLTGGVCTLLGVWSYARFMRAWRYRWIMAAASFAAATASVMQVLVYTRLNLIIGIPDRAFMLGETMIHHVLSQWIWIPGTVLLAQCCPHGMEATMYALLAGAINLGDTLGSFNGAYLLHRLGVEPQGADGESSQFDGLWRAALISAGVLLACTSVMPLFVPDASPDRRLLVNNEDSATAGSPWRRLLQRFGVGDEEALPLNQGLRPPVPYASA